LLVHLLDDRRAERQCASARTSLRECLLLLLLLLLRSVLSCRVLRDPAGAGAGAVCSQALLPHLAHVPTAAEGLAGGPVMQHKPIKVSVSKAQLVTETEFQSTEQAHQCQ
jgi:hypothetical protein